MGVFIKLLMVFVEVILPLPVHKFYTYSVPEEMVPELEIGKRVLVQFGSRKMYAAIIRRIIGDISSDAIDYKPILFVIDQVAVVNTVQLRFWEWIASYYMCSVGEVMQFALPAHLRVESKTRVMVNEAFDGIDALSEEEKKLLVLLEKEPVFLNEGAKKLKISNFLSLLRSLVKKQAVLLVEDIEEPAEPRWEKYVRLTARATDELFLNEALEKLTRARKQKDLLETYLRLADAFGESAEPKPVSQKILLEVTQCSYTTLKALIDKGILETYSLASWEINKEEDAKENLPLLSPAQQQALGEVFENFKNKRVVLLHGVTGSGKTEIYFHLIADALNKGQQVLYLLPEIAITYQIIRRLKRVFGDRVLVYHSRMTGKSRMEVYHRLLATSGHTAQIVLGVRSSIFLPFFNLGLIIVDEEHENSYKQYDPNPRYHARDAAIVLADMFHANVLLGSATPALESYYNATIGKFGLVKLGERYRGIELPRMEIVNMAAARKKGNIQSHFSRILLDEIKHSLEEGKQVLLFHNRRGFAPYVQCQACHYIFRCRHCDVSLTYHKFPLSLTCHYCGYSLAVPSVCPQCQSTDLKIRGFGTEKVEEELAIFFPDARIGRMDQDAVRTREAFDEIITQLEQGELDIVVGTQMITKGLDFAQVRLVGILDADSLLNYPDFRAFERSFQLMVQVGGRAGRTHQQGKVIIQTFMPEHPIIQMALRHDYEAMFRAQLQERQTFLYPPFVRLIHLELRHSSEKKCEDAAQLLYQKLAEKLHRLVLRPQKPIIARMHNQYIYEIHLKILPSVSLSSVKSYIVTCIEQIKKQFSTVSIRIDVDPQ
ncbi:MAG TPA: primosomal protein N' [Bacteroidales bacterium]|nr:primosomal protein N' [Bacteroidales bacterium]